MELAARTMRMNLHSLSKLGFLLTFAVFLGLFVITVLIGIFGPHQWIQRPDVKNVNDIPTMPIDAQYTTGLTVSKLNQRVNLYAVIPNTNPNTPEKGQNSFTFVYSIEGKKTNDSEFVTIKQGTQVRKVTCERGVAMCEEVIVINVPYIEHKYYQFNITTLNAMTTGYHDIKYYFTTVNSAYTLFELWFRFFFLVTTVVIIIVYAVKLRGFEWKDWAIEQRWVAVLLFALLAYNNPTFPLTILLDGAFWPFLSQLLFVSFLVVLMFFWIIMFDGIRTEPQLQTIKTFYLPKMIMLALFWIAALVIFSWIQISQINDPGTDVFSKPVFVVIYVVMIILLAVYILWLSYVVFRAISSRNAMPYLSLRLKFFGIFTLLVLLVVIAGVVGGQLGPVTSGAASLLSFLSLLNLYIYTLAFVYFPSKDVVGRAKNSGMVKLEELDEGGQEGMDEPPRLVAPSHQPSSSTQHHQPATGFGGGFPSSTTPSWKPEPSAPSGTAPIRINFDGLDDDEDGTL